MRRPPADLEVTGILYRQEKNWGMPFFSMPGDNETGFVVHTMSDVAADNISKEGLAYFSRPENMRRRVDYQRNYRDWLETPVVVDDKWAREAPKDKPARFDSFFDKYGFFIELPPQWKAFADEAISSPGNYYAYGAGGGIVIVVPKMKRVIFAYAG